jgi:cell division cycle 14
VSLFPSARPDRLYFCALSRPPVDTSSSHFFTVDDVLRYENFFNDFGPLNINLAYKFCQMLLGKLAAPELANKVIYFYAYNRPQNRSNAAVLIGIYLIVYGGRTSAQAYEPLRALEPYMPFRDASQGLCTFRLMPQHCLRAVAKAIRLGWLDFDNWNSAMYEHFESVENGDCCVIVPGKFLAFAGPHATNVTPEGYPALTPSDYIPIFRMYGVTTVIRLNKKCYERRDFLQAGIAHVDLYHPDGTTPSNAILEKFINVCENAPGMIGVHCKAGLGRTGTTIGCFLMKHFLLSAAETIAWLRLCRPGCVIGPQQHYLKLQEPRMHKLGKAIGAAGAAGASGASSVASGAAGSASGSSAASAASSPASSAASSLQSTPVRAQRQGPAPISGSPASSTHGSAASASAGAAAAAASSTAANNPQPAPAYAQSQPPSPTSPTSPNGQS